jgi:abortive infection bacteriophage resistance protein
MAMANKPAYSIADQIKLLKSRGMLFRDESLAALILKNISYYRLKGYWWDMQAEKVSHLFNPNTFFEDIIDRYNFDRQLRLILFDSIERIEVAIRTKMIYHISLVYGSLWYLNTELFDNTTLHYKHIEDLKLEFDRSQEIFIKDQKSRFSEENADAWKILEVASFGTLSKLYKNLHHQLPEKSIISREMGLSSNSELASLLESIVYLRNIIAHHSRIWSRNMVKKPVEKLNNPTGLWFSRKLLPVQSKKPFLIISCMLYLCNSIINDNQIKSSILNLFRNNPAIPIYKLGFLNNWDKEPIWK